MLIFNKKKMKKRIIFFSLFTIFLSSSCDDSLEIVQAGELNDATLFTSVPNMKLFLNEVYDRANPEADLVVSSLLTDEVAIANGLTVNDTQRFFVVTTDGNAAAIWNNHYNLINYCNRLIRGASLFSPPAADTAEYNSVIAQARALRAFAHMQLLQYFSTDLSNDSALGVMLVDRVPTATEDIPRSTNGEVFAFIEADLNFAEANVIPNATNPHKYVNVNFINAFRARMYLYRKNYPQALFYANAVIAAGPAISTSIVSVTNYPATSAAVVPQGAGTGSTTINVDPGSSAPVAIQKALWQVDQWASAVNPPYRKMWVDNPTAPGEVIFSLDRQNNKNNFSSRYNTNGSYLTGGPLYDMGRNLFNSLRMPLGGGAQDYRRWCFVDRSSTILVNQALATRTNEQIVIDKYPGKIGSHVSNDVKVYRMSEMHFIKAECLARAGDLAGAADQIRQVRQARNYITGGVVPLPVYGSSTAAYADILMERRKELCYEGHRYIDLKRLGADAGVSGTDRTDEDAVNSSATSPSNISITDYRFTLPIPQAEINVNPLQQNPGYN